MLLNSVLIIILGDGLDGVNFEAYSLTGRGVSGMQKQWQVRLLRQRVIISDTAVCRAFMGQWRCILKIAQIGYFARFTTQS